MIGMKLSNPLLSLIAITTLLLIAGRSMADELRMAVSSNFAAPFDVIAGRFEMRTGHKVIQISGSTGKHYAQITNGAPFDAFFAADTARPALLEQQGVALPGSRFTYALGKLILWSPTAGYIDPDGSILTDRRIRHLAIANPRLAPYGRAAEEVLRARGEWQSYQGRLVRGENIGQTFQFVSSGNVALGFVAYSQVKRPGAPVEGSLWLVPRSLYSPIAQQAVLLREKPAARDFMAFMREEETLQTIRGFGYGVPDDE